MSEAEAPLPAAPEGATRVAAAALLRAVARGEPCGAPHLVVREVGGPARRVVLGGELTVGRGRVAALRLCDSGVSRLHARFLVAPDGGVTVEDLGSKNGVRRNGRALGRGPSALAPGDAVVIGETTLVLADALGAAAAAGGESESELAREAELEAEVWAGVGLGGEARATEGGLLQTPGLLLGAGAALLALAGLLLGVGG